MLSYRFFLPIGSICLASDFAALHFPVDADLLSSVWVFSRAQYKERVGDAEREEQIFVLVWFELHGIPSKDQLVLKSRWNSVYNLL
ncbi:hypothetical protein VNO78_18178 [Psophocarpus tetragonolobus]|uniref:Uncharacterized protein n=1 Tax=Psophocarpus tetragonolobus TaxID=3891 RepID=A0AAN9SHZ1_PSOTE